MTQTSLTPRTWIDMALLAGLWGASFLSIKLALTELPVLTLVAHRVVWAALVLWTYVLWRGIELPRGARIWGAFAVMGLLNNAIPFGLMAWGQQFIETGLTSIFNAATAVFGVLVAAMVFADERLTPRRLVGVVLAFAGVALAIGLEAIKAFDVRSVAQLAVLAGALSYAVAAAWARANLPVGLVPDLDHRHVGSTPSSSRIASTSCACSSVWSAEMSRTWQDDIRAQHLFERGAEGGDELGRQIGDEAHRVGQDDLAPVDGSVEARIVGSRVAKSMSLAITSAPVMRLNRVDLPALV
jgi:drug/metabolite transporter (DMT)-like permease